MLSKIFAGVVAAFAALCASVPASAQQWTFYTVNNPNCPTENELTGINNGGKVIGLGCWPSRAYVGEAPYSRFDNIDYPGASASQGESIDNTFDQGGTYVTAGSAIYGYLRSHGTYSSLPYPVAGLGHVLCGPNGGRGCRGSKNHTQGDLLAVGTNGSNGYLLDTVTGVSTPLAVPGASYTDAVGVTGRGDICGTYNGGIWLLRYQATSYITFAPADANAAGLNPHAISER